MAKYRAVLLVPSIVEFECEGTEAEASKRAQEIAGGMGKTKSIHPRQKDEPYIPKVLEVVITEGQPSEVPLRAA